MLRARFAHSQAALGALVLGLFAVIAIVFHAANANDHLEPVRPEQSWERDYHARLRTAFAAAFRPNVLVRAELQPSFSGESAAGVRRAGAGYELFSIEASRPVWSKDEAEADALRSGHPLAAFVVRELAAPIDAVRAQSIVAVWKTMLRQAHANINPRLGCDGETFVFAMPSAPGLDAATVWSPEPASRTGKLVELTYAIQAYVRDTKPRHLAEIDALAQDFQL